MLEEYYGVVPALPPPRSQLCSGKPFLQPLGSSAQLSALELQRLLAWVASK